MSRALQQGAMMEIRKSGAEMRAALGLPSLDGEILA